MGLSGFGRSGGTDPQPDALCVAGHFFESSQLCLPGRRGAWADSPIGPCFCAWYTGDFYGSGRCGDLTQVRWRTNRLGVPVPVSRLCYGHGRPGICTGSQFVRGLYSASARLSGWIGGSGKERGTFQQLCQWRAGDGSGHPLHGAFFGNGSRFRILAFSLCHQRHFFVHRSRYGPALYSTGPGTRLDAFYPATGGVDGALQAAHGFFTYGHRSVAIVGAGQTVRYGRSCVDRCLFAVPGSILLDSGAVG